MAQDQAKQFLVQGINAARAGQKDQARQLFQNALRLDPQNETAWLWMSSVAKDNRERLFCLQNLIQINPKNEMAIKGLQALGVDPNQARQQAAAQAQVTSAPAQAAALPQIGREYLNQISPAIDQFVTNYHPLPPGSPEAIAPKTGRLYGEAAAIRRNLIRTYGVIAAGVVGGLLILGLLYALIFGGEDQTANTVAERATLTPTATTTHTPTATPGVTDTPLPAQFASYTPFPEYEIVEDLPRGKSEVITPTPLAHDVAPAVSRDRLTAQITILNNPETNQEALDWFASEQQASGANCYPELYFYPILKLAESEDRGSLDDAEALLSSARERPECARSTNAYLLDAAECYLNYRYGELTGNEQRYQQAETSCQASLAIRSEDNLPPAPIAAETMARLYLRNGNTQAANSLLDSSIRQNQTNADLFLTRAEVALASDPPDPDTALNYITQALYLNPLLEPALALRVQAYLRQAEIESDEDLQRVRYGTAVNAVKDYMLWYAGSPRAYLLLAQARLGEGNIQEAEASLNRIIQAAENLPDDDPSIRTAYEMRSQIYEEAARYTEALADVRFLLESDPDNTELLQRQMNLAFRTGQYPLVAQNLDDLLEAEPDNVEFMLLNMRLRTVTCQFINEIECEYDLANALVDDFIETLPAEAQAEVLAYRAIARYQLTQASATLEDDERQEEYEQALADLQAAMETHQTGLEYYYLGLLQEALEQPEAAMRSYHWALYWSQFYDYPFAEDLQERIEALQEAAADAA